MTVSYKLNIYLTYDAKIPLLVIYSREMKTCSHKDLYLFIVVLSIIAPNWMELKCPSAGAWVNKLFYVYVMAYYRAVKRNELLIHVTACTGLKIIMSSEKMPHMKDYILYMMPFI